MGFKIHKILGYGFQDMVKNDPRIDWDQFEYAQEASLADFNTYLRLVEDDKDFELRLYWRDVEDMNLKTGLCEYVAYQTEFGMSEILLFTHIAMKDWNRFNDTLDYYDSVLGNDYDMTPSFKYIPYGIYPYEHGEMTHIKTGEKIKSDAVRTFRDIKKKFRLKNGEIIDFGVDDKIDHFAPPIPVLIRHLAKFFGVRDEYIDTMQSGMYEYWS